MKHKDVLFKVEVINIRTNKIEERIKTTEPMTLVEYIIKYGRTLLTLEMKEALELWFTDIHDIEVENGGKKQQEK